MEIETQKMEIETGRFKSIDGKTKKLVHGFQKCATGQVIDVIEKMGLSDFERTTAVGLQPLDRGLPTLAGIAVTVHEGPRRLGSKGSYLTRHGLVMRHMKPGHVLVISAGGGKSSCNWGGLLHLEGMRRGMAGAVIDGSLRDTETILKTKCPVFCKATQPLACHYVMTTLSIQESIVCAGVHVRPGDFVIGDSDGVIFLPPEYAEDVLKLALEKAEIEKMRENALWTLPVERFDQEIINNPEMQVPQ